MNGGRARGHVLVTGASSGIGAALARRFAAGGWPVVLHGRDARRLGSEREAIRAAGGTVTATRTADLALPGGVESLLEEMEQAGIEVEILVNNAGLGTNGPFASSQPGREREVVRVNVEALTLLTRLCLPGMLERARGRILNVASTAAFLPGPYMAAYYASKAYVLSFSEALAEELCGSGITVTALCPGPTRTAFQKRAGMRDAPLVSGSLLPVMTADRVAEAGYAGTLRGRRVVIPGLANRLVAVGARLLPRRVLTPVVGRLNRSRG